LRVELDRDCRPLIVGQMTAHDVLGELGKIFDNYFRRDSLPRIKKIVDKLVETFPPPKSKVSGI
jgi:hypothetical protein